MRAVSKLLSARTLVRRVTLRVSSTAEVSYRRRAAVPALSRSVARTKAQSAGKHCREIFAFFDASFQRSAEIPLPRDTAE